MGLRERNAAKTRDLVIDTALDLFDAQGFEATRMEEIAELAEIGTTTLYRYFPTKDQLVIGPLALRGQMAKELLERPPEEPLDLALGHALVALLTTPRPDAARLLRLQRVLEATPVLQKRLLEEFGQERELLSQAIATRLGRPVEDPYCQMTGRITTSVLEMMGSSGSTSTAVDNAAAIRDSIVLLGDILVALHAEPPTVPRLPHDS